MPSIPQGSCSIRIAIVTDPAHEQTVRRAVETLLPGVAFDSGEKLSVSAKETTTGQIHVAVCFPDYGCSWEYLDREIASPCYTPADRSQRLKERIRLGVYKVVEKRYGIPMGPWGILTGVRPVKLVYRLVDRGFSRDQVDEQLQTVYHVEASRRRMLLDIAQKQRSLIHPDPRQPVAVYVGIPFCPSKCGYCSFASYPLSEYGHLLRPFVSALLTEVQTCGNVLQRLGVAVESVYVGGGTPTALPASSLSQLLRTIEQYIIRGKEVEFTVEAGRAETLTAEVFSILADFAVQRISINPQSMRDHTLIRIGRTHSAAMVEQAFDLARSHGPFLINSDVILGLPGEVLEDVDYTLERLRHCKPDGITVHCLARKRAANWRSCMEQLPLAQSQGLSMANLAADAAATMDMKPYYLYRQRHLFSDLENVGYAKANAVSRYNVGVMEERQTVIGLGAGAVTKLVNTDYTLRRLTNPKCPASYTNRIRNDFVDKWTEIERHLNVFHRRCQG